MHPISHPGDCQHRHPCRAIPQQRSAGGSRPFVSFISSHGPATVCGECQTCPAPFPQQPSAESNQLVILSILCCGPGHDLPTSPMGHSNNAEEDQPTGCLIHPYRSGHNQPTLHPTDSHRATGSPTLRANDRLHPRPSLITFQRLPEVSSHHVAPPPSIHIVFSIYSTRPVSH